MQMTLDLRVKLYLLFLSGVTSFVLIYDYLSYSFAILALIILLCCQAYRLVLRFLLFCLALACLKWQIDFLPSIMQSIIASISSIFTWFYLIFLYGSILFRTTSSSEIAQILQKWKVASGPRVALMVLFRFLPTIKIEFAQIRDAMKIKKLTYFRSILTRPIKTLECLYVPLLYSLMKIGDELTMSALTRGLALYDEASYLEEQKLSWLDRVIIYFFSALTLAGFYCKWRYS